MSVITMASRFVMELFYCNDCNESWYFEKSLNPNLNSGLWKEIDPKDAEDLAYNGSEFID